MIQVIKAKSINMPVLKKNKIFLLILMIILSLPIELALAQFAQTKAFLIVYPINNSLINSPTSFILGTCYSHKPLFLNNKPVPYNILGFFATVIDLKKGNNSFNLKSANDSVTLLINRPLADTTNIVLDPNSIQPKNNLGVKCGDTIHFAVKAKANSNLTLKIKNLSLNLSPKINRIKFDTQYGLSRLADNNQLSEYILDYKITKDDNFNQDNFNIIFNNDDKQKAFISSNTITVLDNDLNATTKSDNTVVRTSETGSRTTPLSKNIQVIVDGYNGDNYRIKYTEQKHVWINKTDLDFSLNNKYFVNTAIPRTINIDSNQNFEFIKIPLENNLPYEITQKLNPNELVVNIYGAKANIEWITTPQNKCLRLINFVTFNQTDDSTLKLTLSLKGHQQWGYFAQYSQNCLYVFCKKPPQILSDLQGLKICIDPGHGGSEKGAIGLSGIKESRLNLDIAQKVIMLLKQHGATVYSTRTDNKTYLDLYDRVNYALEHNSDMLISIHNNSLPDGRNPLTEHGTSTYWYQIQSLNLARSLKHSLVKTINLPDYGTRYQSLALNRTSNILAVLVEVGFVINPDDLTKLINPGFQDKIALGIYQGIYDYIKGTTHDK